MLFFCIGKDSFNCLLSCLLYTSLLCAVAAPHVYEAVTATFTCAGNEFTAKGKTILTPGWKEIDRRFKASFKTDADEDAPELARELPELAEGQTFDKVEADATEHFTTPPKPYTEDTLLSAMERAGAEDMPEDAERQGLGTPATRASISVSYTHLMRDLRGTCRLFMYAPRKNAEIAERQG